MPSRLRLWLAALAVVFLAAHLTALPKTLEDIDSINFALGVEHFDVGAHRPHPPGYPVFIAMAKGTTAVVGAIRPGWDRDQRAAAGLAAIGVFAGALAAFVLTAFWTAAGMSPRSAWFAAVLTVTAPMFWLTASRPLTDTPGLVAAVAVQAWLLAGLARVRAGDPLLPRDWLLGAFAAGFIIGLRSQTLWLTAPLVVWALVLLVMRARVTQAVTMVAAAALGALLWAVPLVWASGGLGNYMRALGSQGSEDFSNIEMLWTTPTWKLFAVSMRRTFIDPWQERTLAHVVLVLALIGLVVLARRQRRLVAIVLVSFAPYLFFHLAFQETITVRYALPMIVPVAGLAVAALASAGTLASTAGVVGIVVASLVFAQPRLRAYAEGAPVFLAMQDMDRARRTETPAPVVHTHHQVWWGVQRLFAWYRPVWDVGAQPFPGDREWLWVVDRFRSGATEPVWFLGDVSRTDLAAFDPRTTVEAHRYVFPPSLRTLIGGARLDSVSWWRIAPPMWMLGRGWSLTPEMAGVTVRDALTRARVQTADAFVIPDPAPVRLVIGGRYLGPDNGPPAEVVVKAGSRDLARWTVSSTPRWFVQWIEMPADVRPGDGPYAHLTVDVRSLDGRDAPPVGLEQFSAAEADGTIYALTDGWNEQEENPSTGMQWRWTSGRSVIEVHGPAVPRTLELSGESPLKSYDAPPTVTVKAGDRVLATFSPAADFAQTIAIPADALDTPVGRLTIELDRTHSPSEKGNSPDKRRLGLRLFSLKLASAGR